MRRTVMAMLAVGAVTAFATPNVAAQSPRAQPFCHGSSPCVPASQQSYNECFRLALQRGLNVTDNGGRSGRRILDDFIYQCLAGRIPR